MLTAADIIAAKLLVQLGYAEVTALRGVLRALAVDPDTSVDLLSRLGLDRKVTREQYADVRRYVATFEYVRYEAVFLHWAERLGKLTDPVHEIIAEIEEDAYRHRIGDVLVARGELTEAECEQIDNMVIASLTREDLALLERYRREDYARISQPLVPRSHIDTRAFRLPVLFRSEETLAAVDRAALRRRSPRDAPDRPPAAPVFPEVRSLDNEDPLVASWSRSGPGIMPVDTEETRSFQVARYEPKTGAVPVNVQRIGPYEVQQTLGAGAMGRVLLAKRRGTETLVAIKVMLDGSSPADRARFEREANVLARLDHPNVVGLIERGEHDGVKFIVMPAFPGRKLRELIAESPRGMALPRACDLMEQMLEGVQAIHEAGIVHRDLKPENVLVQHGKDRVRIVDFGLARMISSEDAEEEYRTAVGAISGSPAYLAPETISGDRIDARTDIYALGTVFFELLTGQTPLKASSAYAFLREHLVGVPASLARARPEGQWRPELEALVAEMLAKEPAHRPASCAAVLERLRGQRLREAGGSTPGPGWLNRFFRRR